ncbi:diguanylate cyclase [Eubacteriales bacterium OttesenSCG-928-A19]|nr:diguanylate cyclase [Eubacteriales bacterium OttesenSCG-928-A19]
MKRVRAFFDRMYFGKNLPFAYRIYMIFFFECLLISTLSATTNTALGKGTFGIVFQWTFNVACLIILFIPLRWRMSLMKPMLIFVSFIYIPFLFFETGGYDGTAGLFSLLTIFLMTIIFQGKLRVALLVPNIALWVAVCVIQFMYPQLIVPHSGEAAKFVDYVVALVLATTGMAILGTYFQNTYGEEQRRTQDLLKKEEESNRRLEELATLDPLTGAYNRRFLMRFLDRELSIVARKKADLYIMMVDVDFFKAINDTWGHGTGDDVLVALVQAIKQHLREYDIVARVGGEEFVLALGGMLWPQAIDVAERVRKRVSELTFDADLRISISIGLVQARPGESGDVLLTRADKCLYRAKEEGRNRVVAEGNPEG